ncbi:amidophosphoribosyltransferase [Geotalea uraniireducens]|uniref:Amidophosphoribosyltransferase n=1 Tax=Geotalea uraniireducens TaxID=351604 RepID=A0ABM8ER16_9BACT|nr:ComF family protein [Geotalea uraniireducens]BDV44737.1 amidophosphoribosyltransferase [Geotalea uraniireducens]
MILRAFLDILFPPLCHVCKSFIPAAGPLHLCPACHRDVRFISSPCCVTCGVPFATEEGIDHRCGACQTTPPPFTAARSAVLLAGPVQQLVHRFKYGHKVHLRRPLALLAGETLAPFVQTAGPELMVPVPLHPRRLRERGFNQAILVGEVLAATWGVPLLRDTLRRQRPTTPQVGLSAGERRENVCGAFTVAAPDRIAGKKILLVDDVYTTGSTLAECARELRRAGAAEVVAVTVARTSAP